MRGLLQRITLVGVGVRSAGLAAATLTVIIAALLAPVAGARRELSPGMFQKIATGVALIRTYGCGGRPIAEGTGFLVGSSVVMTARHVVRGACRVRVRVNGETIAAQKWVYWYGSHTSVSAADIATLKLDHAVPEAAHIFRIRSSSPPFGANISAVGYPLGNRLSLNQGKLVRRWRVGGAPVIVVHMIGAHGGSGSPFLDDAGQVVGILQVGLTDNPNAESSSVLFGLDLVQWWGPRARVDLCRAYPNGGIAGCPSPSPSPSPPLPPPPPPPTSGYSVNVTVTGGGSVVSTPTGLNCRATCTQTFADGVNLSLQAVPDPGFTFAGWGGSQGSPCGTNPVCSWTPLSGGVTVSASFIAISPQPAAWPPTGYTLWTGPGTYAAGTIAMQYAASCSRTYATSYECWGVNVVAKGGCSDAFVNVDIYDSSGNLVDTGIDRVTPLGAGQTGVFHDDTFVTSAASFHVTEINCFVF